MCLSQFLRAHKQGKLIVMRRKIDDFMTGINFHELNFLNVVSKFLRIVFNICYNCSNFWLDYLPIHYLLRFPRQTNHSNKFTIHDSLTRMHSVKFIDSLHISPTFYSRNKSRPRPIRGKTGRSASMQKSHR